MIFPSPHSLTSVTARIIPIFLFILPVTAFSNSDIIATGAMVSFGGPGGSELSPTNGEGVGFTQAELDDDKIYYNPLYM